MSPFSSSAGVTMPSSAAGDQISPAPVPSPCAGTRRPARPRSPRPARPRAHWPRTRPPWRSATPDCGTSRRPPCAGSGNATAVMISSGSSAVVNMPWKKSSAAIARRSVLDGGAEGQHRGRIVRGRIVVRQAAADGAAVAHLRRRRCRRPALPAPGSLPCTSALLATVACVVMAPIVTIPPPTLMPASPSAARSTTVDGLVQALFQHRDEGLAAGQRLGVRLRPARFTASARLAGFS